MPFYIKVGRDWVELERPTDIVNDEGRCLISVYPLQDDPGKITIGVRDDVMVTTERKDRVFPGQEGLANREDVFIDDLRTGWKDAVIYSNNLIGSSAKE